MPQFIDLEPCNCGLCQVEKATEPKKEKKPKYLTEPQAWRAIAEKLLMAGSIEYGLCHELDEIAASWRVSEQTEDRMGDRLRDHVEEHRDRYGCPGGYVYGRFADIGGYPATTLYGKGKFHEERAMACLWMALEAEEEAKTKQ